MRSEVKGQIPEVKPDDSKLTLASEQIRLCKLTSNL